MDIEQVPAVGWKEWIEDNDGVVLDIREPFEWQMGTLPQAVRIRMSELPSSLDSLDPGRPTLVVCRSGSRSLQAAMFLSMSGFDSVANMAGGMKALGMQS